MAQEAMEYKFETGITYCCVEMLFFNNQEPKTPSYSVIESRSFVRKVGKFLAGDAVPQNQWSYVYRTTEITGYNMTKYCCLLGCEAVSSCRIKQMIKKIAPSPSGQAVHLSTLQQVHTATLLSKRRASHTQDLHLHSIGVTSSTLNTVRRKGKTDYSLGRDRSWEHPVSRIIVKIMRIRCTRINRKN